MICKHCKNTINDNSIFCQYCGEKVTRAKRSSKETVSIPKPTVTPSGRFRGQLMYQNKRYFIIEDTEAAYYARGTAIKTGLIKEEKQTPKGTRLIDVIIKFITENEAVLSPTTVDSYYKITRVNFIGYMDMDVSKIPWQAMISNESRLKAPKTVRCAWGLVRTSLDYSKLSIPRVKLPKSCTNERDFLNYEQIQVFIKAINGNPYECVFLLALHSMRDSEIKGLAQGSINNGFIKVKGARVMTSKGLVYKKTNKTDKSKRDIPIMIDRLTEIVDDQTFPISKNNSVINRNLKKICRENGLPEITLHCLRHSFASLAYHLKWSVKTTMRIGGWSTPDIVNRIYTHLANQDLNDDIIRMKDFFKEESAQKQTK